MVVDMWLNEHWYVTLALIFLLMSYVFNRVFRVRRLPLLKEILIYFLLGLGSMMLMFFQVSGLPIVYSLAVAVLLMQIVKIRYWIQGRSENKSPQVTPTTAQKEEVDQREI